MPVMRANSLMLVVMVLPWESMKEGMVSLMCSHESDSCAVHLDVMFV